MRKLNHVTKVPASGTAMPPEVGSAYAATIARTTVLYGLSRSEIYRLPGRGKIRGVKSGRSTLILLDSVRTYVASLPPVAIRAPKAPA
jgi:hypothetical protein